MHLSYISRIATLFAAVALTSGVAPARSDDPLLRPILPQDAKRWLGPQRPLRIAGNSYLVGFRGLTVALIRTDAGLILIDGAVPQGVRAIEANIRALGFRVEDVKLILSTEPHFDHASGIPALARDSGATVVASAWAAQVLQSGRPGADDPQVAFGVRFPATPPVRVVQDGEQVRLGHVVVTAHATGGHTPGSMSWSWQSCEGARCRDIVFASSLNPMAGRGYRFSDPAHRAAVEAFRRSFATLRALPCDVLITAHPDQSGGERKARRLAAGGHGNPFVDPGACRAYAAEYAALLDKRLAEEASGAE